MKRSGAWTDSWPLAARSVSSLVIWSLISALSSNAASRDSSSLAVSFDIDLKLVAFRQPPAKTPPLYDIRSGTSAATVHTTLSYLDDFC